MTHSRKRQEPAIEPFLYRSNLTYLSNRRGPPHIGDPDDTKQEKGWTAPTSPATTPDEQAMIRKIRNIFVCLAVLPPGALLLWSILGASGFLDTVHIKEELMKDVFIWGFGVTAISAIGAIIAQRKLPQKIAYHFEQK